MELGSLNDPVVAGRDRSVNGHNETPDSPCQALAARRPHNMTRGPGLPSTLRHLCRTLGDTSCARLPPASIPCRLDSLGWSLRARGCGTGEPGVSRQRPRRTPEAFGRKAVRPFMDCVPKMSALSEPLADNRAKYAFATCSRPGWGRTSQRRATREAALLPATIADSQDCRRGSFPRRWRRRVLARRRCETS